MMSDHPRDITATIYRLMTTGQIGPIACGLTLREIVAHLGKPEGTIPHSRKDRRPAALKYGWTQIFIEPEEERVYHIGIYAFKPFEEQQLLDMATQQFLRALTPATLFALLGAHNPQLYSGTADLRSPVTPGDDNDLRNLPPETGDLRITIADTGEAIFARHRSSNGWELEKAGFALPARPGVLMTELKR